MEFPKSDTQRHLRTHNKMLNVFIGINCIIHKNSTCSRNTASFKPCYFLFHCYNFFFFFLTFQPCYKACRILVPWLWIEPMASAMEAWSLNHWTAREVPKYLLLFKGNTFSTEKNKQTNVRLSRC